MTHRGYTSDGESGLRPNQIRIGLDWPLSYNRMRLDGVYLVSPRCKEQNDLAAPFPFEHDGLHDLVEMATSRLRCLFRCAGVTRHFLNFSRKSRLSECVAYPLQTFAHPNLPARADSDYSHGTAGTTVMKCRISVIHPH